MRPSQCSGDSLRSFSSGASPLQKNPSARSLTRSACPPPSTRATSCPGSGWADDLREKLTGQGPRPRLVGEALHLPGERRHGRSAPLTLHEQETLWLGCGGCSSPRTPAARRGTPGGPPEALLRGLNGEATSPSRAPAHTRAPAAGDREDERGGVGRGHRAERPR